jgi:hypothetical protein
MGVIEALTEAIKENTAMLVKIHGGKAEPAPAERSRRVVAPAAEPAKETRGRRSAEPKEDPEALTSALMAFMDGADSEKEEGFRTDFIKDLVKHFKVDKAGDIPPRNLSKIERWIKVFLESEDGVVDFEKD